VIVASRFPTRVLEDPALGLADESFTLSTSCVGTHKTSISCASISSKCIK
jgi:hypothetical protein